MNKRLVAVFAFLLFAMPASAQQGAVIGPVPSAVGTAARGQIPGESSNAAATAGNIGEIIESSVASGSAVSINPSGSSVNVTSVSLTAGRWYCFGNVGTSLGAGTINTALVAWITTTSATLPTSPNGGGYVQYVDTSAPANQNQWLGVPGKFYTVSSTTTVYLGAFANFSVSTLNVYGYIGCVRTS
ncbi:MAG: hypothetical protein E6R03_07970 [Hyphomicrobiaceae bacterium]|nr:MAG: hypothetical protein E6R03_07970 [Hyphomicrobiaceae bacterium]